MANKDISNRYNYYHNEQGNQSYDSQSYRIGIILILLTFLLVTCACILYFFITFSRKEQNDVNSKHAILNKDDTNMLNNNITKTTLPMMKINDKEEEKQKNIKLINIYKDRVSSLLRHTSDDIGQVIWKSHIKSIKDCIHDTKKPYDKQTSTKSFTCSSCINIQKKYKSTKKKISSITNPVHIIKLNDLLLEKNEPNIDSLLEESPFLSGWITFVNDYNEDINTDIVYEFPISFYDRKVHYLSDSWIVISNNPGNVDLKNANELRYLLIPRTIRALNLVHLLENSTESIDKEIEKCSSIIDELIFNHSNRFTYCSLISNNLNNQEIFSTHIHVFFTKTKPSSRLLKKI
jgi:hypothetical protein